MKHILVGFLKGDNSYIFRDISTFDEFRNFLWADLPTGGQYWQKWMQRNMTEKKLEDQLGYIRGTFRGAHLIYGEETVGHLLTTESRNIYQDLRTTGVVAIDLDKKEVRARVVHNKTFRFIYPIQDALLPEDTPFVAKYLEFIKDKNYTEKDDQYTC
jgi:hypothetical protein